MHLVAGLHGQAQTVGLDPFFPRPVDIRLRHKFTADTKALAVIKEMGAHVSPRLADTAQPHFQEARGRPFATGAGHMDQPGGVAVGPEFANRLTEQFKPGQLSDRPFGVIDLVNGVVVGKIHLRHRNP